MFGGWSKSYNCAKHMISYSSDSEGCPKCKAEYEKSQHLAQAGAGSFMGLEEQLRRGTTNNYDKQIKELERKFLEVQKLMVEEIEKLNERI
jgi:hypothetical protein